MSVARTTQQQPPRATYQDVLDAPAHLVAEIINGTLYTHPRPAMPHARATWVLGGKIGDPFDYGPRGPGAGGGLAPSPSCTSTTRSWSPTSRVGAASACRTIPAPPT